MGWVGWVEQICNDKKMKRLQYITTKEVKQNMRKSKQQRLQVPKKGIQGQKNTNQKQEISMMLQQQSNIEFRHGRIKYFNDTSVFKIKNQQFKDALVFLKQAEKLLEADEQTNLEGLVYSNCVNQNYACVHYKQFQLQKSQQYLNMIIQNLLTFIQNSQQVARKPNILYLQGEKKNLKIHIINSFTLLSYYLQFTSVSTQLGKHEFAVMNVEKSIDLIKKICQNIMQMQICEYGLKSLESNEERKEGIDMLRSLMQQDMANQFDDKSSDISVVIDMLKQIRSMTQKEITQENIVDEINIMGHKTLSPTTVEQFSSKLMAYKSQLLSYSVKIELTLYMSLCYFTLATLNRLIAGQKYNQFKKESPMYKYSKQVHLRCIFVYVKYIKLWSKYLQFIVNSFNSNYGIDLINSNFEMNLEPEREGDISDIPVYSERKDMIISILKKSQTMNIDQIKFIHSKVSYQEAQQKNKGKIFQNPILQAEVDREGKIIRFNEGKEKNPNYSMVESKKLDFNEVIGLGINLDVGIYRNMVRKQKSDKKDKNKRETEKQSSKYKNYLTIRHIKQKKEAKVQMRLSLGKNGKFNKMHSQNEKFSTHKSPSSSNSHQHKLKIKNKNVESPDKKLKGSKNIYCSTPILKHGGSSTKLGRQQVVRLRIKPNNISKTQRKPITQSLKNIPQYEINNTKRQQNRNSKYKQLGKKQKTKSRKTVGEIPQTESEYGNQYNISKEMIMNNKKSITQKIFSSNSMSNKLLNIRYNTDTSNETNSNQRMVKKNRNIKTQINQEYNFQQSQNKFEKRKEKESNNVIKSSSLNNINFGLKNQKSSKSKPIAPNIECNSLTKKYNQQREQRTQFERKRQNKNYHDLIPKNFGSKNYKTDFSSSIEINQPDHENQQCTTANDYNLHGNKKLSKDGQGYLFESSYQQASINEHCELSGRKKKNKNNISGNELYNSKPSIKDPKGKYENKKRTINEQMLTSKKMKQEQEQKKEKNKKELKKQSKQTISSKQLQRNFKIRRSIGLNDKKQKNRKVK